MADYIVPEEGKNSGITRRKFLMGTGAMAGGLALAGGVGGALGGLTLGQRAGLQIAGAQALKTDLDIVQFALTLEHLETAAYRAVNASGLLSGTAKDLFAAFGDHEAQHVEALTKVVTSLGGTPVKAQASYNLPQVKSQDEILQLFITVEEVGAGAYLGAAPLLQDKGLLLAAGSIHNVEAMHASTLKALVNDPMPSPAFGSPLSYDAVIAAVTPFLQAATPPPAGGYYTNTNPAPSLAVAVNRVPAVTAAGVLFFPETGHTSS
ncbi:MAG: ferritin-like domain-containing protein, partial [Chloroflexia bacterium]